MIVEQKEQNKTFLVTDIDSQSLQYHTETCTRTFAHTLLIESRNVAESNHTQVESTADP